MHPGNVLPMGYVSESVVADTVKVPVMVPPVTVKLFPVTLYSLTPLDEVIVVAEMTMVGHCVTAVH